jgi:PAS domain S-box-containing protein
MPGTHLAEWEAPSDTERYAELLRLLSAATTHLLEATDPNTLVRGVFDIASDSLGIDTYFNYVLNEQGDGLELASCAGIPDDVAHRIRRLDFGQAICGTVALSHKPIVATHIQTSDYDKANLVRGLGIRAYACNPLMTGDRLVGTLSFASRTRDTFNEHELEFFRTICRYVELSVRRLRMLNTLQHHADLLDLAPDAILSLRLDGAIQFWNRGAEQTYGWSAEEAAGKVSHSLLQTSFPQSLSHVVAALMENGRWEGELVHTRRDGRQITVSSRWALQTDTSGAAVGILELNRDITERKHFEGRLRQTQKLESLGILAGGIAHDFNNILVGILGNASLVEDSLPEDSPDRELTGRIVSAAQRAAILTRQLLAYAGKGRLETRPLNLSALAREVATLVQATIPKNVELQFDLSSDLPDIEADVAQLQQVLMNLIINGAEAVADSPGAVRISTGTENVEGPAPALQLPYEISPGRYVRLEVQDTGCGMDDAMIAKIFDPFFTTKRHGTGLGLSAVQGIVRRHKGLLEVYSAPGKGTKFKLLLPTLQRPAELPPDQAEPVKARAGGLILVVDDELIVRQTAAMPEYSSRTPRRHDACDGRRRDAPAIQPHPARSADRPFERPE